MQIIFTHRTRGIGAEGAHVHGMVEAFRDHGHEVIVVCLPGCDPTEIREPARSEDGPPSTPPGMAVTIQSWVKIAGYLVADHAPEFVFGAIELLYNFPLALRLGMKLWRRPGLVYERYSLGNFAPALLCRVFGIPLIVEVNDSVAIERSRKTSYAWIKHVLESFVLSSSDLIVTVTQRFKVKLLEAFPNLPESKILVLSNAVSARRFDGHSSESADVSGILSDLDLSGLTLVGTAGQFLPWHGLTILVSATASLAKELGFGFLFIGDGPVRGEVMETARFLGVEDQVGFTGMVSHAVVPEYLALLDVAVIPSSNQHCSPMKLIEFMAMGLPVVAPDLPNICEVIEDGRTGFLFRAGDMEDLRRRLADVLSDREAARVIGARARDHVFTHLTWGGHARSVLEILGRRRAVIEGQPCTS